MRKVFLAGATGFTGRAVLAQKADLEFVLAVRAGSARGDAFPGDPRVAVVDYADPASLDRAMAGCGAILSTIGTTRAQFRPGVSYETVDYGTTVALLAAGKRAGVDHFVLMSSWGAGRPMGAYMRWKARTERAVIDSGLPCTIVRPSFLQGAGRPFPGPVSALADLAAKIPGLGGPARDARAIPIEVLAWNYVRILETRGMLGRILTGRDLWRAWESR